MFVMGGTLHASFPQHFSSSLSAAIFSRPALSFRLCFVGALCACVFVFRFVVCVCVCVCVFCVVSFLLRSDGGAAAHEKRGSSGGRPGGGGGRTAQKRCKRAKTEGIAQKKVREAMTRREYVWQRGMSTMR